jgi:uncharacterized protein YfkK (UPF0435 family)
MSLIVNQVHRTAFEEIFNLIANKSEFWPQEMDKADGKINVSGLRELFKLIDYKTTEE